MKLELQVAFLEQWKEEINKAISSLISKVPESDTAAKRYFKAIEVKCLKLHIQRKLINQLLKEIQ